MMAVFARLLQCTVKGRFLPHNSAMRNQSAPYYGRISRGVGGIKTITQCYCTVILKELFSIQKGHATHGHQQPAAAERAHGNPRESTVNKHTLPRRASEGHYRALQARAGTCS